MTVQRSKTGPGTTAGSFSGRVAHHPEIPDFDLSPVTFHASEDEDGGTLYVSDESGEECGRTDFYTMEHYVEVNMVQVEHDKRRNGHGRRLLVELQRRHPGVPIYHRGLSVDGLRLNAAVYGPPLGDALTRVSVNDPDFDEYEMYDLDDDEGQIFRGGWTLDGVRIPDPR